MGGGGCDDGVAGGGGARLRAGAEAGVVRCVADVAWGPHLRHLLPIPLFPFRLGLFHGARPFQI